MKISKKLSKYNGENMKNKKSSEDTHKKEIKNETVENKNGTENKNGFGITSLVLGIVGICTIFMPYFAIVLSILSIIFSKTQKKKYGNNAITTAGFVLGIIGTILNSIVLAVVVILFVLMGLNGGFE